LQTYSQNITAELTSYSGMHSPAARCAINTIANRGEKSLEQSVILAKSKICYEITALIAVWGFVEVVL